MSEPKKKQESSIIRSKKDSGGKLTFGAALDKILKKKVVKKTRKIKTK